MLLCNECAAREYLNNPRCDRHPVSVGIVECEHCGGKRFCRDYTERDKSEKDNTT